MRVTLTVGVELSALEGKPGDSIVGEREERASGQIAVWTRTCWADQAGFNFGRE